MTPRVRSKGRTVPDLAWEDGLALAPGALVAGVDEAGRGPLAGPVVAAAVILDPARPVAGLADSKALSPARRELLYAEIQARALAYAIAEASVEEIDRMNILRASLLAMQRAVKALQPQAEVVLVDGNICPTLAIPTRAVVGGDAQVPAISAASILAKVTRDRQMLTLHAAYPEWDFDVHKGYPTARHLAALARHGVSPVHRRSFSPVARALTGQPL